MIDTIDPNIIKTRYKKIKEIWDTSDKWHYKTKIEIEKFINKCIQKNNLSKKSIVNLGSAGNSYGFNDDFVFHVDLVEDKIKNKKNYIVSNIENIEINSLFDGILCVGSVINYCDLFAVLEKCSRLTKKGGFLILEFENSKSLEFIGTNHYNRPSSFVSTFYQGETENLFVYSENLIKTTLNEYGFTVNNIHRFHILSPLLLKLKKNPNNAGRLIVFDSICRLIPALKKHSSNVIIYAQKRL